jgi:ABC-type antimicrobial peptide transport system permease subunit
MDHLVADSMAHPRFCMVLFTLFGGVALVLATVGVYGLTAYSVSQRSHELAIRTALGARPASVIGLVLRTGIRLAEIGIGVGLAGVLAVGRLLRALLFDVSPADPLTLSAAALLLGAVALAASWIPARRATGVAPLIALRQE